MESIDHLLHSDNLPPILDPSATNLPPLTSCITGFMAHCDIDKLLQYPVPPWGWVDKLTLALDKCMGSDIPPTISLRHPTTLDLHLPQWIINHWYSTLHIIKQRDLWVNVNWWILEKTGEGTSTHSLPTWPSTPARNVWGSGGLGRYHWGQRGSYLAGKLWVFWEF